MRGKNITVVIVFSALILIILVLLFLINSKFDKQVSIIQSKAMLLESDVKTLKTTADRFDAYEQQNKVCCKVNAKNCSSLKESAYGDVVGHIVRSSYWNGQQFVVEQLCYVTYPDQSAAAWKINDPVCAKVEVLVDSYNC